MELCVSDPGIIGLIFFGVFVVSIGVIIGIFIEEYNWKKKNRY